MALSTTTPPTLLAIGATLGPYEVTHFVARGGMGVVYRARHRTLKSEVALKVLYPHLVEEGQYAVRFQREASAMAKLRHRHIAEVYNADVVNGYYYLAIEFAPNGTLKNWLDQNKRLPIGQALLIAYQMALALHFAHQHGVIHRDIKPSNILCCTPQRWILSDFGIAQDKSEAKITQNLAALGTPEYMSPEQGQGRGVDARSDVYSLGVVLYEMLAGRTPFGGDNHVAVIYQHAKQNAAPIDKLRSDIPASAKRIVHKALSKHPRDRFQTAEEMAQAIDRVLSSSSAPKSNRKKMVLLAGIAAASFGIAGAIWTYGRQLPLVKSPTASPIALSVTPPVTMNVPTAIATATLVPLREIAAESAATAAKTDLSTPTVTPIPIDTKTPLPSFTPYPSTSPTVNASLTPIVVAVIPTTVVPTPVPTSTPPPTPTLLPPETETPAPLPSQTVPALPNSIATSTSVIPTETATVLPELTQTPTSTPTPMPTATPQPKVSITVIDARAYRRNRSPEWDAGNPSVCDFINDPGDKGRELIWRFEITVKIKNASNENITFANKKWGWSLRANNGIPYRACLGLPTVLASNNEKTSSLVTFFEKDKLIPYRLQISGTNVAVCFVPVGRYDSYGIDSVPFIVQPCRR